MREALRGRYLVAAVALLVTACGDAPTTPAGGSQPAASPARATLQESLEQDARSYAAEYNVSIGEAVRRLRVQEQQGETVARLREANPGRFAGLWLEHQPEFRLVVRLAGNAPAGPEFRSVAAGSPTPVAFVTGAATTEAQVLDRIQKSGPRFRAVFQGLAGTDHDVRNGDIVLSVHEKGASGQSVRARSAALTRQVGHPVRVQLLDTPLRRQDVRGGANLSTCTSGFVVANSAGTRGVTTASHCGNTQSYFEFSGTSYAMTFVAERDDADEDVQWHTTAQAEVPQFYADLTTSARVLTGRRLRSSTAVGNTACHRGKTTGYSCGAVSSTTYQPTYSCGGTTCSATYISVTGANLACAGGDSGGPWFNGQTAFGLHVAGSSSGTAPGQCALAVYMSTDLLANLGVSLVYGV
ncbi:MAG TPA: S1 family peptidase [Longimicrobium sp.]|nr:S1 family peptidase [Longimicrobium sp.]